MPAPSSGRESRRGSKAGAEGGLRNTERKEKAKSSQVFGQSGAVNTASGPQRPQLGTRTTSAPIVERRRGSGYAAGLQRVPPGQEQAGSGAAEFGQDEDEMIGVVGAMRQYEPFRSPQVHAHQNEQVTYDLLAHLLILETARRTHTRNEHCGHWRRRRWKVDVSTGRTGPAVSLAHQSSRSQDTLRRDLVQN